MTVSARNQFQRTVTRITERQAMAEVSVKVGDLEFIAAITEGSVKSMGLKINDSVSVAVKATEVMIGKQPALTWKMPASYHGAEEGILGAMPRGERGDRQHPPKAAL